MWIVRFGVAGIDPPSADQEALLRALLWEHFGDARGVEHFTLTMTGTVFDLTVFVAHAIDDPHQHAESVLDAAFAAQPALRRWIYTLIPR